MVKDEIIKILKRYEELGFEKKELKKLRKEAEKLPGVSEYLLKELAQEEELLNEKYKKEIEELKKGLSQYEEKIEKRRYNFIENAKKILKAEKEIEKREIALTQLNFLGGYKELYEKLKKEINEYKEKIKEIESSSEEGFLAKNLIYLARLRDQNKSRITEVPSVKERKNEIKEEMYKGKIPFLYGETGSGKTEMAIKIAKEISGKEPIVISGNEKTTYEELIGCFALELAEEESCDKIMKRIEYEKENYFKLNPDLSEEEKEKNIELIKDILVKQTGKIISKFKPSRIFEGLKEGRIIIIDEANRIPPSILSSLHRVFDEVRKKGRITVPITGEEIDLSKVEGFPGIILTGNINVASRNRYQVYELEPALKDRILLYEYNTPDQETDPSKKSSADVKKDLYLIGMSYLLSGSGRIPILKAPSNIGDEVWRLSQAFKVFQDAFVGKKPLEIVGKKGENARLNLHKHHASMRHFLNIIEDYKKDGFKHKIDYFIFNNLIKPAAKDPEEAAAFYTVLKDIYNFFPAGEKDLKGEELWPEVKIEEGMKDFPIKLKSKDVYENKVPIEVFSHNEMIKMILGEEICDKKIEEEKEYIRFIEKMSIIKENMNDYVEKNKKEIEGYIKENEKK